mmetsp:Transcript_9626/g.14422  ORF Transcript_9626/g.14422 Transcript_9626/m.14422 type:complete len:100 (-) Transcript_9626:638-937(-)
MVSYDCNESVKISQDVGKEKILYSVHVHITISKILANENERHWQDEEMKKKVWSNYYSKEFCQSVESTCVEKKSLYGDSIRWYHSLRDLLSFATPLGKL